MATDNEERSWRDEDYDRYLDEKETKEAAQRDADRGSYDYFTHSQQRDLYRETYLDSEAINRRLDISQNPVQTSRDYDSVETHKHTLSETIQEMLTDFSIQILLFLIGVSFIAGLIWLWPYISSFAGILTIYIFIISISAFFNGKGANPGEKLLTAGGMTATYGLFILPIWFISKDWNGLWPIIAAIPYISTFQITIGLVIAIFGDNIISHLKKKSTKSQ